MLGFVEEKVATVKKLNWEHSKNRIHSAGPFFFDLDNVYSLRIKEESFAAKVNYACAQKANVGFFVHLLKDTDYLENKYRVALRTLGNRV